MTFPALSLSQQRGASAPAWVFHSAEKQLLHGLVKIALTRTECRLLSTLLQWPAGAVVPRRALLAALANSAAQPGEPRTVCLSAVSPPQRALNMAVSRLRHKARREGLILPLQTVSGEGYALLAPILSASSPLTCWR